MICSVRGICEDNGLLAHATYLSNALLPIFSVQIDHGQFPSANPSQLMIIRFARLLGGCRSAFDQPRETTVSPEISVQPALPWSRPIGRYSPKRWKAALTTT